MSVLDAVQNGLIVSCQALEDEPLHGPMLMAALARSAKLGGAVGIRTNGPQEVEVCKQITGLPVIGIWKQTDEDGRICITPTFEHARTIAAAGADIIAVDVRIKRPFGDDLSELIPRVRQECGVFVMADCETLEDAERAVEMGVDVLSSTFGFQENALGIEPNFELIADMIQLGVPVIAEGGFWYPEQVVEAMRLGAWAVVVGTAITRPREITERFVKSLSLEEKGHCFSANGRILPPFEE